MKRSLIDWPDMSRKVDLQNIKASLNVEAQAESTECPCQAVGTNADSSFTPTVV